MGELTTEENDKLADEEVIVKPYEKILSHERTMKHRGYVFQETTTGKLTSMVHRPSSTNGTRNLPPPPLKYTNLKLK